MESKNKTISIKVYMGGIVPSRLWAAGETINEKETGVFIIPLGREHATIIVCDGSSLVAKRVAIESEQPMPYAVKIMPNAARTIGDYADYLDIEYQLPNKATVYFPGPHGGSIIAPAVNAENEAKTIIDTISKDIKRRLKKPSPQILNIDSEILNRLAKTASFGKPGKRRISILLPDKDSNVVTVLGDEHGYDSIGLLCDFYSDVKPKQFIRMEQYVIGHDLENKL